MSKVDKSTTMAESAVNLKRTRKSRPNTTNTVRGKGSSRVTSAGVSEPSEVNNLRRADDLSCGGAQLSNTFQLDPERPFCTHDVESIAVSILTENLKDVSYHPSNCKTLSQELAACIMEKLKCLNYKRYKIVAIVSLGNIKDRPGLEFGSRCVWNQETDKFASVKYANGSLFAVAMIYGLYFE